MSDATSQCAHLDANLLGQLRKLARKGAYAVSLPEGGEAYAVYSPRNAFAAPIATLSATVMARALAAGLLVEAGEAGRMQLSRPGEAQMRRYLSGAVPSAPAAAPSQGRPHKGGTARAPSPGSLRPARIEGPLAWLHRRKDRQGRPLISSEQFEAGERLAADFARAGLEARVTASWSPTAPCSRTAGAGGGGVEISDGAINARDRLHRVMLALGPEIGGLLIDVCCHDKGLETAEKARRWPQRSAKVVLDVGLTLLARHYGMLGDQQREPRPRVRAWTDESFTSGLAAWR